MEKIKKYAPITIRILIAVLFLLSAFAKLYPSPYFAITTFEFKWQINYTIGKDVSIINEKLQSVDYVVWLLHGRLHYKWVFIHG